MNLDLSREALNLLKETANSPSLEFTRTNSGRTVKFECNGHTLNDPESVRSTSDWEEALIHLLANEFIEESSDGIYRVTRLGIKYADSHLK